MKKTFLRSTIYQTNGIDAALGELQDSGFKYPDEI